MNTFLKRSFALASALLMTASLRAAEPDGFTDDAFQTIMKATVNNNYDSFVANCDDTMKAAITKTQLEAVSKQIAPRVRDGYDREYLGALNQHGFVVHLWRLRFKSGDDVLATLSVKDGKVGGFYLK